MVQHVTPYSLISSYSIEAVFLGSCSCLSLRISLTMCDSNRREVSLTLDVQSATC